MNELKAGWKAFVAEEDGIGTLEMLLIIAVILVCAIAFRKWIFEWVDKLFQQTNDGITETLDENTITTPSN